MSNPTTDLRIEGLARLIRYKAFRERGFPLDTAAPIMLGEAAAVADEVERLQAENARLQAIDREFHNIDDVVEITRLRKIEAACKGYVSVMFLSDHQPGEWMDKIIEALPDDVGGGT